MVLLHFSCLSGSPYRAPKPGVPSELAWRQGLPGFWVSALGWLGLAWLGTSRLEAWQQRQPQPLSGRGPGSRSSPRILGISWDFSNFLDFDKGFYEDGWLFLGFDRISLRFPLDCGFWLSFRLDLA